MEENCKQRGDREQGQTSKPIVNPYGSDLDLIPTTFYVSNFPDTVDSKQLWQVFAKFGKIVDAYIARKQSKVGKRFGFIRFLGVQDQLAMTRGLSNIWIGNFHLYVSVARFQRVKQGDQVKISQPALIQNVGRQQQSYASVTAGRTNEDGQRNETCNRKKVVFEDKDLLGIHESTKILVAKVREVTAMQYLYKICLNEGYAGLKIRHVGGMWVWIEFLTVEACIAF
ncbi:unnamed protein product [Lactuca virosa]|uniref:RRM domain-containing protein n=1 Tax=Lactuca virosa TaxID=75947 RepID=A0AAU9MEE2_9ASTR|nr:unnamed protein product [Lactuca virosa]